MKGTEIRHADVESVSAVSGTGRWLGSTMVKEGSRVRNPKSAFVLSLFRRMVVSFTQVWLSSNFCAVWAASPRTMKFFRP